MGIGIGIGLLQHAVELAGINLLFFFQYWTNQSVGPDNWSGQCYIN